VAQWLTEPRLSWHLSDTGCARSGRHFSQRFRRHFAVGFRLSLATTPERRLRLTAVINSELDQLRRGIAERQRYIEGQQVLIEVLEHDGHDVREQEIAFNSERSKLDQQLQLLRKRQA
jgi:hypothetical protein